MSTSPDAPKGGNLINLTLWDSRRPGIILLKGILWLALIVGVLVALGMNYDIVWDVLTGTVFPGLQALAEMAERALDGFFVLVGLGAAASMATAYTAFVLFLIVLYLGVRKGMSVYQTAQAKKQELTERYSRAWDEWSGALRATAKDRFLAWWSGLGFMDKIVAATFMVLIGIPLALLLSFILGSLVANLF